MPYWKIFVFGGNTGDLSDAARPQGTYKNDMQVLECTPEDPAWDRPDVCGIIPKPRADSEVVYYPETGRLVLFGGWANRWYGDLYTCKVDEVVGPPYNVNQIESFEWSNPIGPITGESKMTISGEGFSSVGVGSSASIRFACLKGFLEVPGEVVSDTEVVFETPNYEKYGPVEVECRLKLGSKALTNGTVGFSFFSVTEASNSLAFGPGLLEGVAAGFPTTFVIQVSGSE